MELKGRILLYDEIMGTWNRHIFPKDCNLEIPEKVPVLKYFVRSDPGFVVGSIKTSFDDRGINGRINITDEHILEIIKNCGIGGYYDKIKCHYNDEGVKVIDSARLKAVAITPFPVHKDYRLDPINNNDEQRVKGE